MERTFDDLFAQYPAIIEQMPQTFTSHQFILRLAQLHQQPYVDALYAYRDSMHRGRPTPFLAVHTVLAQHLGLLPHLVAHDGTAHSTDIFGQPADCARWRRL